MLVKVKPAKASVYLLEKLMEPLSVHLYRSNIAIVMCDGCRMVTW